MTAFLLGLVTGMTSGLLGVGGGIVLVPLLGRFLALEQKRAQATSLAVLVLTATAAALAYGAVGSVDFGLAARLALGGIVGARLGAKAAHGLPSATLRRAFGVLELLVGLRMLVPGLPAGAWLALPGLAGAALEVASGFVTGALSGLLGVGGGVILVPILTLLFGVPQHEAQGVSLFMIIPTAFVGAWTQLRQGHVVRPLVPPIAVASVVTAIAAAAIAHQLPGQLLRQLFGGLLVAVGASMALRPAPPR